MAASTVPWATTPFPLIQIPKDLPTPTADSHFAEFCATEMIHVHNMLLRPLNGIYNQAPYVPKNKIETVRAFLFYCHVWFDGISHHHHGEEEYLFPALETAAGVPGLLAPNVKQHEAFHDGLEEFGRWTKETKPEDYDGMKLRAIIDGFAPVLAVHLADEIPTLRGLEKYDSKKLKEAWDGSVEKVVTGLDPYTVLPTMYSGIDSSYNANNPTPPTPKNKVFKFPPLPGFLVYLVHYWYSRRHKEAWSFAPCDTFGKPRQLRFPGPM